MNKNNIEKIRDRLEKEKTELHDEIIRLREREEACLNNTVGDDIDKATGDAQREILFYLNDHDRIKLDKIKDALQKIDEDRFGVCEQCGKIIADDRINAIPYARYCIKCSSTTNNTT